MHLSFDMGRRAVGPRQRLTGAPAGAVHEGGAHAGLLQRALSLHLEPAAMTQQSLLPKCKFTLKESKLLLFFLSALTPTSTPGQRYERCAKRGIRTATTQRLGFLLRSRKPPGRLISQKI